MKALLDKNQPLIKEKLNEDDAKILSTYHFLTKRPMIIVLNVNDNKIAEDSLLTQVKERYRDYGCKVMQISAKIEAELTALDPAEQESFLKILISRNRRFTC